MNNFKKILFILMLVLISKTQAQVISQLTEKTTDVLKEGETKSFNWLTYKPTTIYNAKPSACTGSVRKKNVNGEMCTYLLFPGDPGGACLEQLVPGSCRSDGIGGGGGSGSTFNPDPSPSPNPNPNPNPIPSPTPSGCQSCTNWGWGTIWLNAPYNPTISSGSLGWNNTEPTGGGGGVKEVKDPKQVNTPTGPDKEFEVIPLDTTKPKFIEVLKDSCSDSSSIRATFLQTIMNDIDSTKEMRKIRDSTSNYTKEASFAINRTKPSSVVVYKAKNFIDTAGNYSAPVIHDRISVADAHLHPPVSANPPATAVPSPSPEDITGLLKFNNQNFYLNPFMARFVIFSGQPALQFAIMITDTAKSRLIFNSLNIDSLIDKVEFLPNGNRNPNFNNWKGTAKDVNSNFGKYFKIYEKLKKIGYKKSNLETLANVVMLKELDLPIRMFIRNDLGEFKELNVVDVSLYNDDDSILNLFGIIECY
jgi:hypothetical protein